MDDVFLDNQQREYRVLETLDDGGDAFIYHVVEEGSGREAALKALKPAAGKRLRNTFRREAETLQQLNALQDEGASAFPSLFGSQFDTDAPHYFIVMERVEGVSLNEYMNDQSAAGEIEALTVTRGLVRLLRALHADGRAYPEMDADEIRLQPPHAAGATSVKVTNWNTLAQAQSADSDLQSLQQADLARAATFLYRMLTGQPLPIEGGTEAQLAAPPRWATLSLVSRRLLATALHPEAAERFTNASAFENALSQALELHERNASALLAVDGDIEDAGLFFLRQRNAPLAPAHKAQLAALESKITAALDIAARRDDVDSARLDSVRRQWEQLQLSEFLEPWQAFSQYFTGRPYHELRGALDEALSEAAVQAVARSGNVPDAITRGRALFDAAQAAVASLAAQLRAFEQGDADGVVIASSPLKQRIAELEAQLTADEALRAEALAELAAMEEFGAEKLTRQQEAYEARLAELRARYETQLEEMESSGKALTARLSQQEADYHLEVLDLKERHEQQLQGVEKERAQLELELLKLRMELRAIKNVRQETAEPPSVNVLNIPKAETIVKPAAESAPIEIYQNCLASVGNLTADSLETAKIEAEFIRDDRLRQRISSLIRHVQAKEVIHLDPATDEISLLIDGVMQKVAWGRESNNDLQDTLAMLKAITSQQPARLLRDYSIVGLLQEARSNAMEGSRNLASPDIAKPYYLRAYAYGVLGHYLALFTWGSIIPITDGPPKLGKVARLLNEIKMTCDQQAFLPFPEPDRS